LKGDRGLELAEFSSYTMKKITEILTPLGIDRLQDVRNPLDVTPIADDHTFAQCVEAILEDENVDCAVVSPVPMTPAMQTLAPASYHKEDLNKTGGMVHRLSEIFKSSDKAFIINIDSGDIYNPLVKAIENKGIPCFRRSDEAVSFLRKWRCQS
jgi:acyl-CoA synthetase (NDP forming)